MTSLKKRAISGMIWSFAEKIGSRGVGMVTMIILARLLTPADFGVIGMLAIFIGVSEALSTGGFNKALIQKKNADDVDFSTVFYINLIFSVILYLILYFCAPLIASFYSLPELVPLTRVLSLTLIINAFSYVQQTILTKDLEFKKLMYVHLPSTIISAVIALIMAYKGMGAWAIIGQQLSIRFVLAIQLWFYSKWKPRLIFNYRRAQSLFSYGGKIMAATIIDRIYLNIYQVIIGKYFPVAVLGYYQNADKLTKTPTETISIVVRNVSFSAFSAIQDDNDKLKLGYKKLVEQICFWLSPTLVLLAVCAEPLFKFILTEKWLPSVPFFQLLCIVALFLPLNSFNLEILNVKGRSDMYLRLNLVIKAVTTIGLFAVFPLGIWALMIFQVFLSVFQYVINSFYAGRFINYTLKEQIYDILSSLCLSLIVGAIIWFLNYYFVELDSIWMNFLSIFGGFLLYFVLARLLNLRPFLELISLIKKNVHNNTK